MMKINKKHWERNKLIVLEESKMRNHLRRADRIKRQGIQWITCDGVSMVKDIRKLCHMKTVFAGLDQRETVSKSIFHTILHQDWHLHKERRLMEFF